MRLLSSKPCCATDFITLGGKFPRLTKKDGQARLKEIKRLRLAI